MQNQITWSERIAEAAAAADEMGLDVRGREDFCFTETLGKKLVPETHLSEAAAVIMKDRHAKEMKTLLDVHFEGRIAAIKQAVESVLQQKASARVELVDSLNSKNSTDDFIALSLSELDHTFSKKQTEAEEAGMCAISACLFVCHVLPLSACAFNMLSLPTPSTVSHLTTSLIYFMP